MPGVGTVLLVQSDQDKRERLGQALESAGYEVIACPGPSARDYTCIGGRERYCPLVEQADVVVLDPCLEGDDFAVGTSADELVEVYAARGRAVILLGSVGWFDTFMGGHLGWIGDRADEGDVLAAVRSAPKPNAFVLRGP